MRSQSILLILGMAVFRLHGVASGQAEGGVTIATFSVDVSPPIGSPVAYVPAKEIVDPLSARGIVITADGKPVVLCAVDFIGIGNEGLDAWRKALADGAGTTADRVSVHALHQHDAPRCDFTTERLMEEHGLGGTRFDNPYLREVIAKTAAAVNEAVAQARPVTHVGFGQAQVEKVASNRRLLGEDGNVKKMRFSASKDPESIAAPEGTIDPWLKSVSFWNGDTALAVLTYYATHPQSHYRHGGVTCEFVGIARNARETALGGVTHVHFTGAAGNVAAGKYNDGKPETRPILAARVEAAMALAWEKTEKAPVTATDIDWHTRYTALPIRSSIDGDALAQQLADTSLPENERFSAASKLAWLKRTEAGMGVDVSALRVGNNWLLNVPGELFVEYQLAAQAMKPKDNVCMAAYEDYGPGYIGTEIAYGQGGYETSEGASKVAPSVEGVLMEAIRFVLQADSDNP